MKNNRIISIIMITIILLLIITSIGILSNTIRLETIKKANMYEIAKSADSLNSNIEESTDVSNENIADGNEEQISDATNIQELRTETINNDSNISSRSEVDRQQVVQDQQDTNSEVTLVEIQDIQPEEAVQYTKLEDVKISLDMDVSKTTGLSKEDFVSLVQNMRYDKTGILEKNAGWIWECCQTYSVNEIFVLGICGIESAWCSASQHQSTHNYSSLMKGGKLIQYASDEEGFEAMIKLLGQKYLTPGASLYHGATIAGVGRCYCNATTWPKKVYTCMQQVFQ